jgi:hypothetical protein
MLRGDSHDAYDRSEMHKLGADANETYGARRSGS